MDENSTVKILVIDDTLNIRMMISKCLLGEGYEVDTASSGHEGMALLGEKGHDIVILDIRMPQLSGTEVLKSIREIKKDTTVVIITAFPTVKNAVECIRMGAADYLRKPFTPEKIKSIVKALVERQKMTPLSVDSYDAAIQYAKKCINRGELDEAVEYLKKSISLSLDDSEPFFLLGNIYELKGDFAAALKYYKIALQLSPGSESIISSIGRLETT
jgi:DNA-binding response OmpR family regulator